MTKEPNPKFAHERVGDCSSCELLSIVSSVSVPDAMAAPLVSERNHLGGTD